MARGKSGELTAGGGNGGGPRQRAAYYENYAKPVIVNWPIMLVAAAALLVVGHFVNWRSGRRLGGDYKKRPPESEDSSNGSSSGSGRRGNQPMSLAELRQLRAEAAEARLKHGASSSSGPGAAKPTPLGSILLLARKIDKLEEEASQFFVQVKDSDTFDSKEEREHGRLLELLTQVQLEIDGVQSTISSGKFLMKRSCVWTDIEQSDESVRPHRKTQTNRVQKLILALEGIDKKSR